MNHPRGSSMDPPAEWYDSANDLVSFFLFHFWTKLPACTRCAGWGWAVVGSPPQQGRSLLPSAGRGGGSAAISAPQPWPGLPPAPFCEEGKPRPLPSACPSPGESRGSGRGRCRFWESDHTPGGGIQVSQAQTPTPQGGHTTLSLLAQALPLHHHPLAGDGLPDRGGFLTLFSSWKWKPSFPQRGRKALGRRAENILESAGGGLGPAAAWVGQAGSAVPATGYLRRALLPAVELFRVFLSHHVEPVCNGSILKGKGTESRFLVSGPDPVQCGRKGRDTRFHWTSQMSGGDQGGPLQRLDTRSKVRGEGPHAVRADARRRLLMFTATLSSSGWVKGMVLPFGGEACPLGRGGVSECVSSEKAEAHMGLNVFGNASPYSLFKEILCILEYFKSHK